LTTPVDSIYAGAHGRAYLTYSCSTTFKARARVTHRSYVTVAMSEMI
jgi:hypothetical protein